LQLTNDGILIHNYNVVVIKDHECVQHCHFHIYTLNDLTIADFQPLSIAKINIFHNNRGFTETDIS